MVSSRFEGTTYLVLGTYCQSNCTACGHRLMRVYVDLEAESVVQVVVVPLTLMHDAIENAEIGIFLSVKRSWILG